MLKSAFCKMILRFYEVIKPKHKDFSTVLKQSELAIPDWNGTQNALYTYNTKKKKKKKVSARQLQYH